MTVFLSSDQIEMLYQPVYAGLCGKTCDAKASCSCGTISGIYQCACGPGLYGSGDPGKCARTYDTYLFAFLFSCLFALEYNNISFLVA